MPLLRNGAELADPWTEAGAAGDVPPGPVIVPLARWQSERDSLGARNAPLGIRVPNTVEVATFAADLGRFDVIALEFPKFNDGRAYSQARVLRERYGYRGEIRATGQVLRDQLLFMHRCGFDAFEIARADAAAAWRAAIGEFDVFFQPTGDGRPFAARLRQGQAAAQPNT